jgi:D-3-phosphoglycerate dehydrogenase
MVNSTFLDQMKEGSFLINTARGGLINEESLVKAIESGHIRGAALDAVQEEPPSASNPLLNLPQVIITPHIGAQTDSARNNMGWAAYKDCLAVLKNEQPINKVG